MNIKLILFSVVVAGVAFIAVFYWKATRPLPDPITPFQHEMLAKGYVRNHDDHRWYPRWQSYTNNGCVIYGTALDATFKCRTPLSGGIPDGQ